MSSKVTLSRKRELSWRQQDSPVYTFRGGLQLHVFLMLLLDFCGHPRLLNSVRLLLAPRWRKVFKRGSYRGPKWLQRHQKLVRNPGVLFQIGLVVVLGRLGPSWRGPGVVFRSIRRWILGLCWIGSGLFLYNFLSWILNIPVTLLFSNVDLTSP